MINSQGNEAVSWQNLSPYSVLLKIMQILRLPMDDPKCKFQELDGII